MAASWALPLRNCSPEPGSRSRFSIAVAVAVDAREVPRLDALRDRAAANGVVTRVLTAAETLDYEMNVRAVKALRVEATGIIVVSRELAVANGNRLILGARVDSIRVTSREVRVGFGDDSARSDLLINCARLQADRTAALAGTVPDNGPDDIVRAGAGGRACTGCSP